MDALRVRYVSVLKYIKKRCWRLYGIRLEFNLRDCAVGTVHPLIRLSAFPVFVVFFSTCAYSLHAVATRPAEVAETLVSTKFASGTRGFASPDNPQVAVCLRPGTEIAFKIDVQTGGMMFRSPRPRVPNGAIYLDRFLPILAHI